MDRHTPAQRSKNMRAVKGKGSQIELLIQKELWSRGLRYRKNVATIYGKPDIAFIRKKIAVFCDSEFWHGYAWEITQDEFQSKRDFWLPKIERNMQRDQEVNEKLRNDGWIVLRFWGKEIKRNVSACADIIEAALRAR